MNEELVAVIAIVVSCIACVALPSIIVWLVMRRKTNRDNRQAEIILAAIEKNPDLDVEDFMKKLAPPKKTEAEKLNDLLRHGLIASFIGVAFLGFALFVFFFGASQQAVGPLAFICLACLGVGISNLIAYKVRRNKE